VANLNGCPDLVAKVWFESPNDHEVPDRKEIDDADTLRQAIVTGDKISHTFTTRPLNGVYYAHISLTPFGFECALALDEDCTDMSVAIPCDAKAFDLTGTAIVNTKVGQAPIH
jgi:hypothetical protein